MALLETVIGGVAVAVLEGAFRACGVVADQSFPPYLHVCSFPKTKSAQIPFPLNSRAKIQEKRFSS